MEPIPQFIAKLSFHFREHGADRQHKFVFNENLHRRVPMKMDGIDGLNTVGMWVDTASVFETNDSVMRKFSPLAMLHQFGIQAAILTAITLGVHWVRYHVIDLQDFVTAVGGFIVYLFLASWIESRKTPKL